MIKKRSVRTKGRGDRRGGMECYVAVCSSIYEHDKAARSSDIAHHLRYLSLLAYLVSRNEIVSKK